MNLHPLVTDPARRDRLPAPIVQPARDPRRPDWHAAGAILAGALLVVALVYVLALPADNLLTHDFSPLDRHHLTSTRVGPWILLVFSLTHAFMVPPGLREVKG